MAFRWSAADGQTLNADLAALTYNFVIFQCVCVYICVCVCGVRGSEHPITPSGSLHVNPTLPEISMNVFSRIVVDFELM